MKPNTRGWWIGKVKGRTVIVDVHRNKHTGNLCGWIPGWIRPVAAYDMPGLQWRRIDINKLKFCK